LESDIVYVKTDRPDPPLAFQSEEKGDTTAPRTNVEDPDGLVLRRVVE
jgi:hypothetical protein